MEGGEGCEKGREGRAVGKWREGRAVGKGREGREWMIRSGRGSRERSLKQ